MLEFQSYMLSHFPESILFLGWRKYNLSIFLVIDQTTVWHHGFLILR